MIVKIQHIKNQFYAAKVALKRKLITVVPISERKKVSNKLSISFQIKKAN